MLINFNKSLNLLLLLVLGNLHFSTSSRINYSSVLDIRDAKITDPVFAEKLETGYQPTGNYLVTVSLGMPWAPHDDWEGEAPCWKLIAGVIEI